MLFTRMAGFPLGAAAYVPKSSQANSTPYGPASSQTPYVPQSSANNPNADKRYTLAQVTEITNQYLWVPSSTMQERQKIEAWGLAPKLPACPANSLTTTSTNPAATNCYTGSTLNFGPPGSFELYSIPFNILQFKPNEKFQMVSTVNAPTEQQILHIEYWIRKRSAQVFNKYAGQRIGCLGYGPSVNKVLQCIPEFTWNTRGLKYNPIEPRGDELDGYNGYMKWIERGGYPLIKGVTNGTISLDEAVAISVCQSILCRCPNTGAQAISPVSCVKAWVMKDGTLSQHPRSDQAYFWSFIKITGGTGAITLSLDYNEPSKLERFANGFASTIDSIFNALCAVTPYAQAQIAASSLPKCIHKTTKKPCNQGEKDCTCTSASGATIAQNAAVNAGMSVWCKAWASQQQPVTPDFPIDNIMPPIEAKPFPWAWLIGGLAVVGVIYAARK